VHLVGIIVRKLKHISHVRYSFLFENLAFFFEIKWKSIVERGREHVTKWRTRIAWWPPQTTNALLGYELFIDFILQNWLHECA